MKSVFIRACGLALTFFLHAVSAHAQSIVATGRVNAYDIGKSPVTPQIGDVAVDIVDANNPIDIIDTRITDKDGCWSVLNIDSSRRIVVKVIWRGKDPKYLERASLSGAASGFVSACSSARLSELFHPVRLVSELLARAWDLASPMHAAAKDAGCSLATLERVGCFYSGVGKAVVQANAAALSGARQLWERAFSIAGATDLSSSNIRLWDERVKRARFEMDLGAYCQATALFEVAGLINYSTLEGYRGEVGVQWLESAYACLMLERLAGITPTMAKIVDLHGLANRLLAARSPNSPEQARANARLLHAWLLSFELGSGSRADEDVAAAIRKNPELSVTWDLFRAQYSKRINQIGNPVSAADLAKEIHRAFGGFAR